MAEVAPEEAALVERVKQWFMGLEAEELIKTAYAFADQNCHLFEPELGEHKLVYTELHHQFRQLFEDKLNAFLASLGCSPEAFYVAFEKCSKVDPGTETMAELMYCCLQYEFFCQVMSERKADALRQAAPAPIG
uniref:Cilia- and flagella-associated protein 36 n=1 Tax=Alexandrium catenella TaxID=2925 RepID=A0A7S1WPJ6_ALECA